MRCDIPSPFQLRHVDETPQCAANVGNVTPGIGARNANKVNQQRNQRYPYNLNWPHKRAEQQEVDREVWCINGGGYHNGNYRCRCAKQYALLSGFGKSRERVIRQYITDAAKQSAYNVSSQQFPLVEIHHEYFPEPV